MNTESDNGRELESAARLHDGSKVVLTVTDNHNLRAKLTTPDGCTTTHTMSQQDAMVVVAYGCLSEDERLRISERLLSNTGYRVRVGENAGKIVRFQHPSPIIRTWELVRQLIIQNTQNAHVQTFVRQTLRAMVCCDGRPLGHHQKFDFRDYNEVVLRKARPDEREAAILVSPT